MLRRYFKGPQVFQPKVSPDPDAAARLEHAIAEARRRVPSNGFLVDAPLDRNEALPALLRKQAE